MFDVMTHLMICVILDCYICAKSLLVYLYAVVYVCQFWRLPSRGGRQNRQKKLKKILMFIGYVHRLT
jgi:hypothetical protein